MIKIFASIFNSMTSFKKNHFNCYISKRFLYQYQTVKDKYLESKNQDFDNLGWKTKKLEKNVKF